MFEQKFLVGSFLHKIAFMAHFVKCIVYVIVQSVCMYLWAVPLPNAGNYHG